MRSRGTRNKSCLIDKMAKMAHLSIIDFLKEFTSKEFERLGKGIWNYLKFHCSLKMWNLSILNQSIRKQKRNLKCEFGIPPREESTELSILKLVNGISQ